MGIKINQVPRGINWRVRVKNPVWWAEVAAAFILPALAYAGITAEQLTSWAVFGRAMLEAFACPWAVLCMAVAAWNAITDPTTAGVADSERAMTYDEPAK